MAPHKRPRPLPPPPDHPIAASDEASLTGLDALAMLQQKQDPGIEKAGDDAQTISEKELALEAEERREDFYGRIGEVRSSDEEYDEANSPEFLFVKVADVREIVRCPICLGIIRKTRTVMECLHRFCRECIDKSMRLGNNECPACRTHCASRRSLRDDPKYDALIAALYPDIDKYEEEELSFFEEERSRSQKIQLYIAETFQRQSEALGRKRSTTRASTSFGRKSQGSYLRGRGRKNIASDDTANADSDEEADANGNYGTKGSSATDEPSPDWRPKRPKEWGTPQSSPARTLGSVNVSSEENEDFEINREPVSASPLQSRSREILAWGKNGTRSQTRHNSSSSSNGRLVRGAMGKLADFLRNLEEVDEEFDVNVIMVPLDESMPNLEQPYLSCRQTLLITHLRQFIALQASAQPEEVEIFVRKPQEESLAVRSGSLVDNASTDFSTGLKILEGGESLGTLYASYTGDKGELVLVYYLKIQR
ncbi:putative E3 ubiquitin-protein ligase RING1a isoform X1 [Zingiber officinale]|uniref:putative E3 ubiquitin-protein ligase RING1a isoform X1 n=1 Tax=Zingiber officinale TaxID=94328 RepID=UPI001C4C0064|nr:putative E3 ubiquitin-protein ligase RING1a isoform X1 [Zingiber officinale]